MIWTQPATAQYGKFQEMFKPAEIRTLLQSSDSRDQAWGAWLAGQSGWDETIPLLKQIVAKRLSGVGMEDTLPLDAALDALILLEAKVSQELISAVYPRRSAQALVLLSMLEREGDPLALSLAAREKNTNWFALANLLLAHRTPGTAALFLRDLEIRAEICISDGGGCRRGIVGGVGGGVSDGVFGAAPGYPPIAYYYLTTTDQPGNRVFAVGPTTIYYRRQASMPGSAPAGPVHDTSGPIARDRLQYLAALGDLKGQMRLYEDESREVRWRGNKAFEEDIKDFKQDLLLRYSQLLEMLQLRGLLTPKEISSLPPLKIDMHVQDARSPQ